PPLLSPAKGNRDFGRKKHADPSKPILQWEGFRFELDAVVTRNARPDVHLRRGLQIGVTVLEDDFRIPDQETVFVQEPPAQDERVLIKQEIRGIQEQDFAQSRLDVLEAHGVEADVGLQGGLSDKVAEVAEGLGRNEAIASQNELHLEILQLVNRLTVAIDPVLEFGDVSV